MSSELPYQTKLNGINRYASLSITKQMEWTEGSFIYYIDQFLVHPATYDPYQSPPCLRLLTQAGPEQSIQAQALMRLETVPRLHTIWSRLLQMAQT